MKRAVLLVLAGLLGTVGCDEPVVEPLQDPVVVTAQVERAQVTPGRPFELSIEINQRADVEFEVPDVGSGIKGLVIMDMREEGPEQAGGRVLTRTIYKLKAPLTGTYLIPGIEGLWRDSAGEQGNAGSGPILIEAAHAAGEEGSGETALRDLKPALKPQTDWNPAIVGGLLLALLLLALWLVRRAQVTETVEPPRPPHELALADLKRLLTSALLQAPNQGPFAYEVSAILRRYLESSFGFPAWRMTTAEVLRAMPPRLLQKHRIEAAIREVLEASDRVKFAGDHVPEKVLRGWVEQSVVVVNDTTEMSSPAHHDSSSEAGS